ncbi:MAG: hypothetical protein QOH88_1945 [Verrucomicrobiota bacterium]|jgi:hypothetical protein
MDLPSTVQIALLVWVIIGVAGVARAAFLAFNKPATDLDERLVALIMSLGLGGSGLITLAFAVADWPLLASYGWRLTALMCVVIGSRISLRFFIGTGSESKTPAVSGGPGGNEAPPPASPPPHNYRPRWAAGIGTVISAMMLGLSFRSGTLWLGRTAHVSGAPARDNSTFLLVSVWWIAALLGLAFGTVYFLRLFVRSLEEGGAPQIETHWGGIGGALGGWRMSRSLGYLLVSILLAILCGILFLQWAAFARETENASLIPTQIPAPTPTPTPTPSPVPKSASAAISQRRCAQEWCPGRADNSDRWRA